MTEGSLPSKQPNPLQRQLELTRFDRALEVAESLARHRALLTTTELARMNNILTGTEKENPWRQGPVTLTLPSGRMETLALIADPINTAREMLHRATERAENSLVVDAAVDIYVGLVLSHVFEDANRRTAVLASHYFLKRYGITISGMALHELGLGDLREEGAVESLREIVKQMAKFGQRKNSAV